VVVDEIVVKGVMSRSRVDALSELCSPFLKGGNSVFIAAIVSGLFRGQFCCVGSLTSVSSRALNLRIG